MKISRDSEGVVEATGYQVYQKWVVINVFSTCRLIQVDWKHVFAKKHYFYPKSASSDPRLAGGSQSWEPFWWDVANFHRIDLHDNFLDCLRYFNRERPHVSSLWENYTQDVPRCFRGPNQEWKNFRTFFAGRSIPPTWRSWIYCVHDIGVNSWDVYRL